MEKVISEPRSKVVRKCTVGMSPGKCRQREPMERPRGRTLPGWLGDLRKVAVAGEEGSGRTGDAGREEGVGSSSSRRDRKTLGIGMM